jgi:hypothetical protein
MAQVNFSNYDHRNKFGFRQETNDIFYYETILRPLAQNL